MACLSSTHCIHSAPGIQESAIRPELVENGANTPPCPVGRDWGRGLLLLAPPPEGGIIHLIGQIPGSIMSPWNLVASLSCNHSPRSPADSVLPQRREVKDLICSTEFGKGLIQEPRKSSPSAL